VKAAVVMAAVVVVKALAVAMMVIFAAPMVVEPDKTMDPPVVTNIDSYVIDQKQS
jgi:flagellar assembly factor FliW